MPNSEARSSCSVFESEVSVGGGMWASSIITLGWCRNGKVDDAEKMLNNHLEWRAKTFPLAVTEDVKKEMERTKYAFYHHDKEGRRVVVCRLKLMGKHTYTDLKHVEDALVYLAEYMESILDPLEKITVIFSRIDAARENSDLDWVKLCGSLFQNNYPERLERAVVGPINAFFIGLWAIAKYFFDPATRQKIVLTRDPKTFLEYVDQDKLPVEVGGTCTDPLCVKSIMEYAANAIK
mmetsp:Transcript_23265/g.37038  ORF Transcript_23265/g.37038 Transcript_23265/m.37038 type:complete len:236 (-) Transcript_23265:20-727(-)